ncbi:EamA family transporter [Fimbriimonas ginsengisoli]|nr:EamA family transporter [Fimbriimonas ginsengisoli]
MPPAVYALVLFSAVLHAGWNAALRGGADRQWAAGWMALATFAVALPALPFLPLPSAACLPYLLFSSVLHCVYMWLLVEAYRHGDLGVAYPIARGSSPILVTLGALIVVREIPSPIALVGIGLVSLGILAIAHDRGRVDRRTVLVSLATGAAIACYTVSDGLGVRSAGNGLSYNAWLSVSYGLTLSLIFTYRKGVGGWRGEPRQIWLAVGGGVVSVVAYTLVTLAMRDGAMGLVSALRETSVLFAALIGRYVLGEELRFRRFAACAAVALGAVLLAR